MAQERATVHTTDSFHVSYLSISACFLSRVTNSNEQPKLTPRACVVCLSVCVCVSVLFFFFATSLSGRRVSILLKLDHQELMDWVQVLVDILGPPRPLKSDDQILQEQLKKEEAQDRVGWLSG